MPAPNTSTSLAPPTAATAPESPFAPVVLVTGAAKRLGREIALKLAANGWRVAVHYRDSVEDATKTVADCAHFTPGSAAFRCNLSNETAVRNLVPTVIAHLGRIDAVVNSASTFEHDDANSFSFAAMEKHMRSNAGAAILLAQALHTHITARQQFPAGPPQGELAPSGGSDPRSGEAWGHQFPAGPPQGELAPSGGSDPRSGGAWGRGAVVNLLDQKLWNQNPDFMSYTLSKAALEAANTMLALALAPRVRVVGVAPGLTLTSHLLGDDKFEALHKLSPLGRSSTPDDVAATVLFALQNQSITGTTLLVDGGQHLMRFERDFSLM